MCSSMKLASIKEFRVCKYFACATMCLDLPRLIPSYYVSYQLYNEMSTSKSTLLQKHKFWPYFEEANHMLSNVTIKAALDENCFFLSPANLLLSCHTIWKHVFCVSQCGGYFYLPKLILTGLEETLGIFYKTVLELP